MTNIFLFLFCSFCTPLPKTLDLEYKVKEGFIFEYKLFSWEKEKKISDFSNLDIYETIETINVIFLPKGKCILDIKGQDNDLLYHALEAGIWKNNKNNYVEITTKERQYELIFTIDSLENSFVSYGDSKVPLKIRKLDKLHLEYMGQSFWKKLEGSWKSTNKNNNFCSLVFRYKEKSNLFDLILEDNSNFSRILYYISEPNLDVLYLVDGSVYEFEMEIDENNIISSIVISYTENGQDYWCRLYR